MTRSKRSPTGRPTRLTPQAHDLYVKAIIVGVPKNKAAALIGMDVSTVTEWMRRGESRARNGRAASGVYVAFAADVRRAEAEFVTRALTHIQRAASQDGQWTAAAWLLERRHPEDFGRVERPNAEPEDSRPLRGLPAGELKQLAADFDAMVADTPVATSTTSAEPTNVTPTKAKALKAS